MVFLHQSCNLEKNTGVHSTIGLYYILNVKQNNVNITVSQKFLLILNELVYFCNIRETYMEIYQRKQIQCVSIVAATMLIIFQSILLNI